MQSFGNHLFSSFVKYATQGGAATSAPAVPTPAPKPGTPQPAAPTTANAQQGQPAAPQPATPAPQPAQAQSAKSPSNAIKFRGGYTVNADPSKVDWSDPGVTNINVGGVFMSKQQHDFYKNMQGQLYRSYMTQGKMSPDKARALSGKRALQYIGDQTTVAAGGEAANRWQYRDKKPEQTAAQATNAQQGQPADVSNVAQGQPTAGPDTTKTDASLPTAIKPMTPPAAAPPDAGEGQSVQGENPGATEGNEQKVQRSTVKGHDAAASKKYIAALNAARKSTLDPKEYAELEGRNGVYRKIGDTSGALYDRYGNQFTYEGKPVDSNLLAGDDDWWLPGYGHNILHNISAHEANRFQEGIFKKEELARQGFTKPVGENYPGLYMNPDTGEIIDGNGKVYGGATDLMQLPNHRPNSARHGDYDMMAWWYDGSKRDVGVQAPQQ